MRAPSITETLRRMRLALECAKGNRAGLSALYVEWIGYCPFLNDPTATESDVFDTLRDYVLEVGSAHGIHSSEFIPE